MTSERERDRLLAAGWTVLRRNGYADAGVADILAEAALGTRAFYRHFDSKDQLLIEMFVANARVTEAAVTDRVAACADPVEAVLAWIDALLDLAYDPRHAELARMFASPIFDDAGHAVLERLQHPLHDALRAGVESGAFPDCDPATDTATIHAIVWARFTDAMSGEPALTREAARSHVARFAMRALGCSDGSENTSMS